MSKINFLINGIRNYSTKNNSGLYLTYHPVHSFNNLTHNEKIIHQSNQQQLIDKSDKNNVSQEKDELPTHKVRSTASSYLVVDDA